MKYIIYTFAAIGAVWSGFYTWDHTVGAYIENVQNQIDYLKWSKKDAPCSERKGCIELKWE